MTTKGKKNRRAKNLDGLEVSMGLMELKVVERMMDNRPLTAAEVKAYDDFFFRRGISAAPVEGAKRTDLLTRAEDAYKQKERALKFQGKVHKIDPKTGDAGDGMGPLEMDEDDAATASA